MDRNSNINDSGVLISQDAIENSLHKKAQRKLTLAQLPVYRAAGNLKFVIIGIAKNAPRNLRRFTDSLYEEADNLATSIGSADVSFSVEDRRWYTKLAYEIYMAIYLPTISICFLVKYPKLREVFAADFRDRIVHHWIIIRLEPLFERRFQQMGNISFNCRKGFGTLAAVKAAESGMREVSRNYTQQAWVFKGDLVSFFMSIRRNLLWYLLERFIRRHYDGGDKEVLLRTVKTVVYHHPEDDCIINGDPKEWQKLPKNKSMFTIDRNLGGPIGNHTTQQFANFYLSILFDLWLLFLMRGADFRIIRFVDDFLIICDDKDKILQVIPKLVAVTSIYGIHIHNDKKYLQPVNHGVLFVGGYIKPRRTYVSSRTIGRFQERVFGFRKQLDENKNLTYYDLERIEQVINSYLGFCVHHQSYQIRKENIINLGDNFWKYFYVKGHYESIRIRPDYRIF